MQTCTTLYTQWNIWFAETGAADETDDPLGNNMLSVSVADVQLFPHEYLLNRCETAEEIAHVLLP